VPYIVGFIVFAVLAINGNFAEGIGSAAAVLAVMLHLQSRKQINWLTQELGQLKSRYRKDRPAESGSSGEYQSSTFSSQDSAEESPNISLVNAETDEAAVDDAIKLEPESVKDIPVVPKDPYWDAHVQDTEPSVKREDGFIAKAYNAVYSAVYRYFTDGNLFVRIGILILFVGVSFLLKYASEHSKIPLEYRIAAIAIGGFAVLYFGWRLRNSKGVYALLLQGCGIGVLYLVFFSSFKVYDLLPPTMTFVLLVALGAAAVALAVLQNSRALAAFGITGGFIAPLLASTGSGNYVALFAYYILLNIGVISTAWFKSWRIVNLIGFGFTFAVFTAWMALKYESDFMVNADAFLIAFFLMYSATSVLFALRQPLNLKGYVDGTLVFGTPMVVWGLQMAIMNDVEYGVAISAILFGLYHVVLARYLWNKHNDGMRLFSLSLLSIGVVFLTLSIPYSLDGHWTSATWALEGAGILWVSLKQDKKFAQYFSVLLQLVAAGMFVYHVPSSREGLLPVLNPYFLGGMFISISSFFSAWQLYKYAQKGGESLLLKMNPFIFIWAAIWWVSIGFSEIEYHTDHARTALIFILPFFIATSSIAWYLRQKLSWKHAEYASISCVPILLLLGMTPLTDFRLPFGIYDGMLWFTVLAYSLWLLKQYEVMASYLRVVKVAYVSGLLFYVALLGKELGWVVDKYAHDVGIGWQQAAWCIVPCLALYAMLNTKRWPIVSFDFFVAKVAGLILIIVMALWSLAVNVSSSGDAYPIDYYPLLNPLDIMHVVIFVLAYKTYLRHGESLDALNLTYSAKSVLLKIFSVVAFVWINAIVLRTISYYFDVYYELDNLWHSSVVQVSLSILWTVLGMLAMVYAARKLHRNIWIGGAVLVGVVVLKLVAIDLAASGTIERIISFMAVGVLLVGMGYFSPIPAKNTEQLKANSTLT